MTKGFGNIKLRCRTPQKGLGGGVGKPPQDALGSIQIVVDIGVDLDVL